LAIIGVDGHVCVQGIRVESHVSGTHNRPVIGLLGAIGRDTELDGTSTRSRSTCALSLGSGGIEFALAVGETDCVLRLKRYTNPKVLVIDELGYLRYDNRFADIFFEVVRLRYENRVPIVLTTNKGFSEWIQIFESAACLVTLIDRLCHHSDIVQIAGESYRLKEAMQRSESRDAKRKKAKSNKS
jgi:hypothetical protein